MQRIHKQSRPGLFMLIPSMFRKAQHRISSCRHATEGKRSFQLLGGSLEREYGNCREANKEIYSRRHWSHIISRPAARPMASWGVQRPWPPGNFGTRRAHTPDRGEVTHTRLPMLVQSRSSALNPDASAPAVSQVVFAERLASGRQLLWLA
jgi:hypothetical protein